VKTNKVCSKFIYVTNIHPLLIDIVQ